MADCSYSRCIQQRRNIRKELQKWTKNMVYIVGLERIAEELMGRRKWKLYQDSMQRNYLQPLNNNIKKSDKYEKDPLDLKHEVLKIGLDPLDHIKHSIKVDVREEVPTIEDRTSPKKEKEDEETQEEKLKDWSPPSKCYFCVDGKLDEHNNHGALSPRHTDSDSSDSRSDVEAPPTLTPSSSILNNLNNHRSMTALESVTSMATLAAVAALSGNPQCPTPHIPFYSPNMLQPQWFHLSNIARNFQTDKPEGERTGEQPLDLSSKGGSGSTLPLDNKVNANIRLPSLDAKHIFKAKPRMSAVTGRRTYTEEELQAALRDIQSGKLGTRRAAVIYGIPRSTLRNKVYKLALERERESHLNSTSLKIEEEEGMMEDEKELSGAEEEKEVEKALERPLLSVSDILRFSNVENAEALKALLQQTKDGQALFAGVDHSAIGPYLNVLMGGLLTGQKSVEGEDNFPEVVKRLMAEEQLLNEQLKNQNNGDVDKIPRPSPSNSVIVKSEKSKSESDMEAEDSASNVILKIPSFKPTGSKNGDAFRPGIDSRSLVSPPVTSESNSPPILPGKGMTLKDVKDVIAKSISQKFQQSPEPLRHPIIDMDFKRSGFTPPLGNISVIKTQPEMSRQFQVQQQQHQQQHKAQQNSNSNNAGGKGTRPKRGKYRNYDRDSLVEAVRAVQRGEMSVHRAGSYYGVPHSTLEYKVKERHLMRPRKRDPKPNPVDEKIASLKQNDLRNAANNDKLKPQVIKPPQKFPPTSPNGMKLPMYDPNIGPIGYNPPPFPFWPPPGFHHMPMEYGRSSTSTAFPSNPEQFLASQMMQKLHEESSRPFPSAAATPNSATTTPALAKNAREIAESLLDSAGSNGFLDGIIRSSLESGVPSDDKKEDKNVTPENMSNKALLDQLCRNSRLTPLPKPNTSENCSNAATAADEDDDDDDDDDDHVGDSRDGGVPLNYASNTKENDGESKRDREGGIAAENSHLRTIELSNDSNDSSKAHGKETNDVDRKTPPPPHPHPPPTGRIYLKQELTKPENLKPEMLVRYRDVLHDVDRNGVTEGSASETDAAQD